MNRKLSAVSVFVSSARIFFLSLFVFPSVIYGADPLFVSDKVIRMELKTDFSALQSDRTGTPSFHEGEITYRMKGAGKVVLPVKVMVRGNFRLNPANCNFPPLFIDFKKNEVDSTLFENQNKLKLVTPCQSEEDLIDEYTVYKMYNHVTEQSLKARLVRMTYKDIHSGMVLFEKYSFFIEDKEHAAERNNAEVREENFTAGDMSREHYLRLSVFQYIIGNLDWSILLGKNLIIMEKKDSPGELFAIPYDFDFSAFVHAEYSKIRGLEEDILAERRQYLGSCYTEKELREAFDFYMKLRPAFESIIKKHKPFAHADRTILFDYLNEFYAIIRDSSRVRDVFLSVCDE